MKELLENKRIQTFVWIIYLMITFTGVYFHEANRDEAQAWLIVRDLNLSDIFSQLSIKGHPGLWYLILLPFAKLGFPYYTMHFIHWLIMAFAGWLIIKRSTLPIVLKFVFIFSYYILFEYTVVARNYGLSVLVLFLIASIYEQKKSKSLYYSVLIFLLFNSTIHAWGAATGLTILFIYETIIDGQIKKNVTAISILIAGALISVIQLLPAAGLEQDVTIHTSFIPKFDFNSLWVILTGIQNAFIPVTPEYEELKIALFFSIIFFIYLFVLFRENKKIFFFLLLSCGWLFYIFTTKLSGSWRHEGLILIFIIFSLWVNKSDIEFTRKFNIFFKQFLIISLFVSSLFGLSTIKKEILFNFSGSKQMANFIKDNGYSDKEISCYRSWRASALCPYLPQTKFWFIEREEYGTFFKLDNTFNLIGDSLKEEDIIKLLKKKNNKSSFLLLVNEPLKMQDTSYSAVPLFKTTMTEWGTNDEEFYLYDVSLK